MDILNDKQDAKYLKLCENFDPMSLTMKEEKVILFLSRIN